VSLLPTPKASDSTGTANFRVDGTPYGNGYGSTLTDAVRSLLPTPAARDWKSGASNLLGRNARPLNEFVVNLLPTPKASDGPHGGPNQRDTQGRYYLPGQAVRLDDQWIASDGTDYGPAIRRWEHVTDRAAPCPTEPGTRGNRRLSPAFVEWMMGLPAGWVTAVPGIPRKEQLKILGNGVVPQQAHHAYGLLLGASLPAQREWRSAA
jgi:DNA (cytosine-5)-methyltransferase 1